MLDILQVTPDQFLAILIAGCLEGSGIPWPGAVIVAAAGVSIGGDWITLITLACLFSVSYCVGAIAQYMLARFLGRAVLAWLPKGQQEKLASLTSKYGKAVVLWTRPLAIGNYVSIPAGIMRMNLRQFTLFTFLGIMPWAIGILHLGGLLGDQVGSLQAVLARWTLPFIVAMAVGALALATWKLARSRVALPAARWLTVIRPSIYAAPTKPHICQEAARRTVETMIHRGIRPGPAIAEAAASS